MEINVEAGSVKSVDLEVPNERRTRDVHVEILDGPKPLEVYIKRDADQSLYRKLTFYNAAFAVKEPGKFKIIVENTHAEDAKVLVEVIIPGTNEIIL